MSYTTEQKEKNEAYVMQEMADYTHEQRGQLLRVCNMTWPDDAEIKTLVAEKIAEIAKEASPDEMKEVMQNFRL